MAAARIGARTALLTTNLDTVGQMSCNPAIGGVAKGHLVREIDALGGIMGKAIDETGIQFRMLNLRKGPAMHSPRAQADKKAYQNFIKFLIEDQDQLDLRQEIVEALLFEDTAHQPETSDNDRVEEQESGVTLSARKILGVQLEGSVVVLGKSSDFIIG